MRYRDMAWSHTQREHIPCAGVTGAQQAIRVIGSRLLRRLG